MVEVFKTDVIDANVAQRILDQIHEQFCHYQANFALDDCDKILRIKCLDGIVAAATVIAIVDFYGFNASILADDFQSATGTNSYAYFEKNL